MPSAAPSVEASLLGGRCGADSGYFITLVKRIGRRADTNGVLVVRSLEVDLDDLARVLEREARLLVVTEAAPVAAAAEALRRLRREELHRALIVADLRAACALPPTAGWCDLLAALPERGAATLAAHASRLRPSPALPPSLRDFLDS